MPTLGEIGRLSDTLSNSLISNSFMWKREAFTIKQTDLLLFLHKYKHTQNYGRACREVHTVVLAGVEALINGELEVAEFAFFEFPKIAFTSEDLEEWMSCVSLMRQKALLFALEMDMDPRTVIGLEWSHLPALKLTPIAAGIVATLPHHMNLKYVFWDFLFNGAVAPLFALTDSALEVSQGLGFGVLRELYKRLVIVDSASTEKVFASHINTLRIGRSAS